MIVTVSTVPHNKSYLICFGLQLRFNFRLIEAKVSYSFKRR